MDSSLFLHIDVSTPVLTNTNSQALPHQPICMNFSLKNATPNIPYQIRVSMQDNNEPKKEIGYSIPHQVMSQDLVVTFNLTFIVDYFFEKVQTIILDIAKGESQMTISAPLSAALTQPNRIAEIPLPNTHEILVFAVHEVQNPHLILNTALKIDGLTSPSFYVAKKIRVNPQTNQKEAIAVYKSETSNDGIFQNFAICASFLDFGDRNRTIAFDFYISNTWYGTFETTINNLTKTDIVNFKVNDFLVYAKATLVERRSKSFIELWQMKLNMNLVISIDFTGSNGHYKDEGSLHYQNANKTPTLYEAAIRECGQIWSYYDSDQIYPVYGFGAILPGEKQVSHCFPLNWSKNEDANIKGIQNVLDTYRSTLPKLRFSGPTYFSQFLELNFTLISTIGDSQGYFILLILTDGVINDKQKVIDLIVNNSDLPVSVIIVGIGDADFKAMEELDSDETILTSSAGVKAKRDIVQFVPFKDYNNDPTVLAAKVLEELPRQVEMYYAFKV